MTDLLRLLEILIQSQRTAAEMCRDMEVSPATIKRMLRQLRQDGAVIEVFTHTNPPLYCLTRLPYWCDLSRRTGIPAGKAPADASRNSPAAPARS